MKKGLPSARDGRPRCHPHWLMLEPALPVWNRRFPSDSIRVPDNAGTQRPSLLRRAHAPFQSGSSEAHSTSVLTGLHLPPALFRGTRCVLFFLIAFLFPHSPLIITNPFSVSKRGGFYRISHPLSLFLYVFHDRDVLSLFLVLCAVRVPLPLLFCQT
jgi:hypothetical protein